MIFLSEIVSAQLKDYGIWSSATLEKKYKKFNLEITGELRTFNNTQDINRMSIQFISTYNFKFLNLGLGYQFIYFHDIEYNDYQPRQRYIGFLTGKKSFGNFQISLRERVQRTIKDERDRIKPDGTYDTYKINPEWDWRNRIKFSYYFKNTPFTTSLSFESFYILNNPDGDNYFNKLRYTLGFDYKLSKKHNLEIYGLIDKDINVKNPIITYVTGIAYKFSL